MNKDDLLAKLRLTKPALSSNDMFPVATHYCFNGDELTTYNDLIGITTRCETPFKGAIPGELLLAMISGVETSKPLEMKVLSETELQIKALPHATFKFAMLPPQAFIFEIPDPEPKDLIDVDMKKFVDAITCCLRSASDDSSSPEQLGVTMILRKDQMLLFSTDNTTLSHALVKMRKPASRDVRVVLSVQFCRQLIALAPTHEKSKFYLRDTSVTMTFGPGNFLYGRLIRIEREINFEAHLRTLFDQKTKQTLVEIPKRLASILELSKNVTEGPAADAFTKMRETARAGQTKTHIWVDDNYIHFSSKSERGVAYADKVTIHKDYNHPNRSPLAIDPKRLKEGCGPFSKMVIGSDCVVMTDGADFLYLVSGDPVSTKE